jgi:biopolymer transport protein ExbB
MENVNPLIEFIKNETFIAVVLILMSLVAVAVIVERLIAFRDFGNTTPALLQDVLGKVQAGRDAEALRVAQESEGPVAKVAQVILANSKRPLPEVERIVQETAEEFFLRLERMLPILDTITTLSPLWGLFGTIVGMIKVFVNYAGAKDDTQKAAILPNVGTALYATAGGILIALVTFIAYNYFASRRSRVIGETEQAATKLINALEARGTFSH